MVNVIVLSLALCDHTETKKEGNQSSTSVDAFHKQSPFAPADRARGVPAHSFPGMRLRTPRRALSRNAKWPGVGGSEEEGTDLPDGANRDDG